MRRPALHTVKAQNLSKPRARRKRLVVVRLEGETLVYDLDTHRAHCLNATAHAVWRLCNGRRTIADIARAVPPAAAAPPDSGVVLLALRQLRRAGLLDDADEAELPAGPSRRELLVQLGKGAAVLLPLVASVVAPTAAQAATPNCPAGIPIDVNLCKSDDPIYLGCCCTDKDNICINTGGTNQDCKGAVC